ncbi:MAG TPA: CehA/McbA family metallohydrolase [Polyangia bacterium]|nr:CehA/McbA family metallohydrolase [Polyangia bacterium]
MSARVLLVAAGVAALAAGACRREGCVGGDDGTCVPPSACQAIVYACPAGGDRLTIAPITKADVATARAPGPKALAAVDDFLLENDRVRAVIDNPGHPQGLAPTGGSIIDLSPLDPDLPDAPMSMASGDQVNGIYQAAGVLPRDAVHYDKWELLDHRVAPAGADASLGAYVAIVFHGHLEGDARVTVVTRYELRPCEPGLRVRTDLYNGARDPNTFSLADGYFWGDRTLLPFIPIEGGGFRVPDLDLLNLGEAWRTWPFMAARSQATPEVAYAVVPCDHAEGAGFNDPTLSAAGVPLAPTLAGDGLSYERFILAAKGPGLAPAVDEALRVRTLVHGDPSAVRVTGRVVTSAGAFDGRDGRAASLLFYEPAPGADPDDPAHTIPRTEAVPGADGRYTASLPPGRVYRVQPYAFGLPAGPPSSIAVGATDLDAGDLTFAAAGHLTATVEETPGERATFAELVLVPVDAPAPGAPVPSLYSDFAGCLPMLGPPHGGSPACNRALTSDGRFDLLVPPGHYYVYATRGPFASLDRREVTLGAGDEVAISLLAQDIPNMVPAGTLSGDFHVHGGASYDSSIPDQDRVVSFLASGVDVIVATDHDVVTTYEETLAALGVGRDRLVVLPGVEETPNILWFEVPGERFPKTMGHFNFWPLARDTTAARNGAPWDELREPGQMFDDMKALFVPGSVGVRQLNHPWADSKLGRDQGFLKMIQMDPRRPLTDDTFASNVLLRSPGGGGKARNIDWDVQEVMTGASRRDWLRYRTLWFSLLNQGYLRAGAANSDSHTLSIERVGYPRNLVYGGHTRATFDRERFDADVRAGHMVGTNGPILDVTIDDADGQLHRAGLEPFKPAAHATLTVAVTAAPWVPVTELRVFVNGVLKTTVDVSKDFAAANHFGLTATSTRKEIALAPPLLPDTGDAWIIVEAGLHQDTPSDTDDDGLPDLPDDQLPTRPPNAVEPGVERFDLEAVAPGVWPTAFTNPFLLDRTGDGWTPPGLP